MPDFVLLRACRGTWFEKLSILVLALEGGVVVDDFLGAKLLALERKRVASCAPLLSFDFYWGGVRS